MHDFPSFSREILGLHSFAESNFPRLKVLRLLVLSTSLDRVFYTMKQRLHRHASADPKR